MGQRSDRLVSELIFHYGHKPFEILLAVLLRWHLCGLI